MPYSSISELPANIKNILPTGAQTVYRNSFNAVYEETKDDGKAAAAGWAAVKKAGYVRGEDGNWSKESKASVPNSGNFIMRFDKIEVLEIPTEQSQDEEVINARIPSFRLSKFNHPHYGIIEFTDASLRTVIDNFHGDVVGTDLAINEGHKSDQAIGWIKDLERTGKQINVMAHMTEEGLDLIKKKKYKYASIEYERNFVDPETGKEMGTTLVGLALTNKPFISRQGSVSVMSMDDFDEEELESVSSVIVLDVRYQKEETMNEENKSTEQESKTTPMPQDEVKLSRAEYEDLKTKYLSLQSNAVELEKQTAALKTEVRNTNIDKMMLSAEARITDGKKMAPAVIDWARNFMKGTEINGVKLSNDNATDYIDAAITHLLNDVIPCTVPVQSANTDEALSRPEDTTEGDKVTQEDVSRFWA